VYSIRVLSPTKGKGDRLRRKLQSPLASEVLLFGIASVMELGHGHVPILNDQRHIGAGTHNCTCQSHKYFYIMACACGSV